MKRLDPKTYTSLPIGQHSDGLGLVLEVREHNSFWKFRYSFHGQRRKAYLGTIQALTLAAARTEARKYQDALDEGRDPADPSGKGVTFEKFAEETRHALTRTLSPRVQVKWQSTLRDYCYPKIGKKPIADVRSDDIIKIFDDGSDEPIWTDKPRMAKELGWRLQAIFKRAKKLGRYSGDNPAADLKDALGDQGHTEEHQNKMAWEELPDFMVRLAARSETAAIALQIAILTGARTGEIIGMRWSELDLKKALWTIPAKRMKMKRPHVVPLVPHVVELLRDRWDNRISEKFVFPKFNDPNRTMSNMALLKLLQGRNRLNRPDVTVHGFRGTFSDWAHAKTNHPDELIEHCLAHITGSSVKKAYFTDQVIERRRDIMNDWARFAFSTTPAAFLIVRRAATPLDAALGRVQG